MIFPVELSTDPVTLLARQQKQQLFQSTKLLGRIQAPTYELLLYEYYYNAVTENPRLKPNISISNDAESFLQQK